MNVDLNQPRSPSLGDGADRWIGRRSRKTAYVSLDESTSTRVDEDRDNRYHLKGRKNRIARSQVVTTID